MAAARKGSASRFSAPRSRTGRGGGVTSWPRSSAKTHLQQAWRTGRDPPRRWPRSIRAWRRVSSSTVSTASTARSSCKSSCWPKCERRALVCIRCSQTMPLNFVGYPRIRPARVCATCCEQPPQTSRRWLLCARVVVGSPAPVQGRRPTVTASLMAPSFPTLPSRQHWSVSPNCEPRARRCARSPANSTPPGTNPSGASAGTPKACDGSWRGWSPGSDKQRPEAFLGPPVRLDSRHLACEQPTRSCSDTSSRRGFLRRGFLRYGLLRCGFLRCGLLRCGLLRCGFLRCGLLRCGFLRDGLGPSHHVCHVLFTPFRDHSVLSQYPSRNRIATARQGAFLPQSRRRPTADPTLCNELLRGRGPSQMRQRSNAAGPLDVRHGWPGRANTAARGDGPTWGPRAHHLRPQVMKSVASQCDSIRKFVERESLRIFSRTPGGGRRSAVGGTGCGR